MTVLDLRQLLAPIPDDTPVVLYTSEKAADEVARLSKCPAHLQLFPDGEHRFAGFTPATPPDPQPAPATHEVT